MIEEYEQGIIKKKTKRKELLILDSLRLFLEERGDVVIDSSSFLTVPSLNTDSMTVDFVEIKEIDAILLSNDELIEKHNIESSFSKLWLRQAIKVDKNPKSAILFGIGNIIWMLFVLIPVVALFMKLLFIRRSKYYIEHLVFLYHWHVSGFIIMSVYFLLMPTIHPSFVAPFILSVLGFGFVALRRYYRQGFFKSFVKYILLLCSYLATAIILLILSSIVSLMVF